MKAATEEELAAVDGMNKPAARKVYEFFHSDIVKKSDMIGNSNKINSRKTGE
jgi:excinuclease ABC subunit C